MLLLLIALSSPKSRASLLCPLVLRPWKLGFHRDIFKWRKEYKSEEGEVQILKDLTTEVLLEHRTHVLMARDHSGVGVRKRNRKGRSRQGQFLP